MDLPKPPQDQELRNIIDKLAQFVARNGSEFEQMTKHKQKDNPKFGFLFGGEHFNYYQYKVTTEQAILNQKAQREKHNLLPTGPSTPPVIGGGNAQAWHQMAPTPQVPPSQPPPPPPSVTLEAIVIQQQRLQEQIQQSEQNLVAQQQVMAQQQQAQAEEALRQCQEEKLQRNADEVGLDRLELDTLLQPIIDSCTKDAISQGKGWILAKSNSNSSFNHIIAMHLLSKVTEVSATFPQKLHVIYLVNDVLHHCVRKNADELRKALECVVVPMFCNASIGISDDQRAKLNKLLILWESKNNYLDSNVVEKLKQPQQSWAEYRATLISEHAITIAPLTAAVQATYEGYRAQHQAFVSHASQQIQVLEQQKIQLEQAAAAAAVAAAAQAASTSGGPTTDYYHGMPPATMMGLPPQDLNFSQPPPGYVPLNVPPPGLPDLSRPPPGFMPPQVPAEPKPDDMVPSVPYYELPAGLMVTLIKLEDSAYKLLDPDAIRLPPPAPPSERLIAAVEAFYGPPSHERPRDSEGWEKLGLYEYYRAKNIARKKKDDDIKEGLRMKSRSPSPIIRPRSRSKSPLGRRYRSLSRSVSPKPDTREQQQPPRTASPVVTNQRGHHSRPNRDSPGPAQRSPTHRERERGRENRSPTPPSFLGSTYGGAKTEATLDESNKGHQMLRKMGWGGAGLGAKEQGIEQPISGGEIRDRQDMYKGIGINLNDPYENFRKSKAQSFINRMKARAEET